MDLRTKQRAVIDALEDVKGRDIQIFNTARLPSMFERVVIASGDSTRQVKALADRVQEKIKELGSKIYGVEGESAGEWVLVDLGDVVVHIMHPTVRTFYNLEEVWGGKPIKVAPPEKKPAAKVKAKKARKAAPAKKAAPARKAKKTSRKPAKKAAKAKARGKASRSSRSS